MSIVGSEKIFVDPNQEITFLLEKVFNTKKTRIILVVPEYSIILSSIISLKILLKLGQREGKSFILVTESNIGFTVAQRAGFITVRKVSQITAELWEAALNRQLSEIKRVVKDKDKFIDPVEVNIETEPYKPETETIFSKMQTDEEHLKDLDKVLFKNSKRKKLVKEVKIEPKVVNIGGIQIVSGGDVKKIKENGTIDAVTEKVMERKIDLPEDKTFSVDRFAGKDISRVGSKKGIFASIQSFLGIQPKVTFTDREEQLSGGRKKGLMQRKGFLVGVSAVTFIAVLAYFVVFQWSYLTINIKLKTEKLETQASITAHIDPTKVNTKENIIEAKLVALDSISQNKAAKANGDGKDGEKAKGFVYMLNRNEKEIILPPLTEITSVASAKKYILTSSVTLPAAKRASDGSLDPSRVDSIQVEAETFGEEYNITSTQENNVFTIASAVPGGNEINVRRESAFEGGTVETFVSVSKENIEEVRKTIVEEITKQAQTKLQSDVPEGFILLKETIKLQDEEVTSSPEVDKEALEDGTFTVSVETKVTALAVKQSDLEEVIANASANGEENTNEINISNMDITNVQLGTSGATFDLSSSATAAQGINEQEFINQIAGKSLSEIQEILAGKENIETFRINYVPTIVPESIRVAPNNKSNIKIVIQQ